MLFPCFNLVPKTGMGLAETRGTSDLVIGCDRKVCVERKSGTSPYYCVRAGQEKVS